MGSSLENIQRDLEKKFDELFGPSFEDQDEISQKEEAKNHKMPEYDKRGNKTVNICNPIQISNYLKRFVIGQDEVLKMVSIDTAFVNLCKAQAVDFDPLIRLIQADTGQGKTHLFKTLASITPVTIHNMATFTEAGFKGKSIEEDLINQITNSYSIIVLDEIDKKVRPSYDKNGQNVNFAMLSELNAFFSGVGIKNVIFYLVGAFSEIREAKKEKKKDSLIGFGSAASSRMDTDDITREDLVEYGLPRELSSRVTLMKMNRLSRDDFRKIILNRDGGVIASAKERAALFEIKAVFSDEYIEELVDAAYRSDTGARGLFAQIDRVLCNKLFDALKVGKKNISFLSSKQESAFMLRNQHEGS